MTKIKARANKFNLISGLVDALIKTGENKPLRDIINIGTGKEHSVMEIIEIAKKFGEVIIDNNENNNENNDERSNEEGYSNRGKSRKMLNWTPKYSIEEGLEKTYEWFNQYKEHYLEI